MRHTSLQQIVRRSALMLALIVLSACSNVALPNEGMPTMGADPSYGAIIAGYVKSSLQNSASYEALEISGPRWVHSVSGWNWLVCVRFQDRGHQRTYAFFFKDREIINSRYAVQADACGAQTYAPFDLTTGAASPVVPMTGAVASAPVPVAAPAPVPISAPAASRDPGPLY
jgi:hypothetical protein